MTKEYAGGMRHAAVLLETMALGGDGISSKDLGATLRSAARLVREIADREESAAPPMGAPVEDVVTPCIEDQNRPQGDASRF